MTVIAIDRRAIHVVVNRPRTLDYLNDLDALAQDVPALVTRAWDAMNRGDMSTVIHSFQRLLSGAEQQRAIAHELCESLNGATAISGHAA